MDDVHGKEINLVRTTVKIPGQKPRGCRGSTENSVAPQPAPNNNVSVRGKKYRIDLTRIVKSLSIRTVNRVSSICVTSFVTSKT